MWVGLFINVDSGVVQGVRPLARSENESCLKEYAAIQLKSIVDSLPVKDSQLMFATFPLDSLPLIIHKNSAITYPELN